MILMKKIYISLELKIISRNKNIQEYKIAKQGTPKTDNASKCYKINH